MVIMIMSDEMTIMWLTLASQALTKCEMDVCNTEYGTRT